MIHITNGDVNLKVDTIVTLGNFDGVHLGHKRLIAVLNREEYKSLSKVVFSFYPHPAAVIKGEKISTILNREEKYELIKHMGAHVFVEYPFTVDFAKTLPADFIKNILVDQLRCKVLVIGEGYRFGKDKSGDAGYLKETGEKYGIETVIVPHYLFQGDKVSSSGIRNLISSGHMEKACMLLGRNYSIQGKVQSGNKIGRKIGFPTINLVPDSEKILPPNGVYATHTIHEKYGSLKSVTNVGMKPTVDGRFKTVETYILDFQEDLYGEKIKIEFFKFLREEKKFNNIDELKNQIEFDKNSTVKYFEKLI